MYHGFDFKQMEHVLLHEMNWTWMLLSFPFGIMAQVFRGWRWKQTLAPMDEKPRTSTCVNAVFLSYAASLVIPRIGEFARCGALTIQRNFAMGMKQSFITHLKLRGLWEEYSMSEDDLCIKFNTPTSFGV